ncbi:extracellular solute-binding protein [Lichenifustis flavocetrariae]|uniref:Extracellular solute-binding protein n=1 Tax=Lichenifustis flavocetrariae TaxID=2949735 RepID=A0AA41YX88_9HYPH|nr:extracellular solute-binding protein [Lichenifustis flavocetrariae]MCW6508970.1 extracellular solute-binding protein [Lichenifustis flavocetrariae]
MSIRDMANRGFPGVWLLAALALSFGSAKADEAIASHGAPALSVPFPAFPFINAEAPKGGHLSLCFLGTFDSLNPFNLKAGSTAQGLIVNVYESLMTRSPDEPFTLYGLIASSLDTDEARSFVTFHLDPAAHFSDGTPIRAEDVLFTFELLKTKGRPQQRAAFSLIHAAQALDPLTVRFDLQGLDDREMPLTLGLMPVLSKAHTDPAHFDDTTLAPPVSSGPYTIASVEPGQKLQLRRDPNYWARDRAVRRGMFNFDTVDLTYYRDANGLFEAFKAGLCDYRIETDPTRWLTGYDSPAVRDGRIVKQAIPSGLPKGMEGFAFNTRRPLFADIRVREALGEMFDFAWLNGNLFGGLYTRTDSFFADSELSSTGRPADARERALLAPFPDAVRPDIMAGTWRPPTSDGSGRDRRAAERALALLGQAGYRLDGNRLVGKSGQPFSFEIMVVDRHQERLALLYADDLKRIGITLTVRTVDEVQYQRRRQAFDFDMMFGTWTASPSPGMEQRSRWGSASAAQQASFNLAGARSPAIDAMIGAMLAARTHEDFVAAVRAYDRVLLSGFYIIPLYHTNAQWIAYASRLGHPDRFPLFGVNNVTPSETWWRRP